MNNKVIKGMVALACVAGLCACSSEQEPITGSAWKLTSMEAIPAEIIEAEADTFVIEFNADDQMFFGRTNCNGFFGPYTEADGHILTLNNGLASTKMACPEMEYEDAFLQMLEAVQSYQIKEGVLTLYGADQALATFRRTASQISASEENETEPTESETPTTEAE